MKKKNKLICKPSRDPKSKKNILLCSLDIGTRSGKHLSEPLKLIVKGQYHKERSILHKILDISGAIIFAILLGLIIWLAFPRSTTKLVIIDASVAPKEVITGGSSTLTFRYENKSNETIRDARILFSYPEHFLLESLESDSQSGETEPVFGEEILIGDINPSQYGFIHVKGTMFGDVGGEQVFTTKLIYDYGENKSDEKIEEHNFSPSTSTLALELQLPDHLVSKQVVEGSIIYSNTGDIAFPDMTIMPEWPESFRILSSSLSLSNDGAFHVKGILPGDSGVIKFSGIIGPENDNEFSFFPSFQFGENRYAQNPLIDSIDILPPPLTLTHRIEESALDPGGNVTVVFFFENSSQSPVTQAQLRLSGPSAVLGTTGINNGYYSGGYYYLNNVIDVIQPGESAEATITIPIKYSIGGGLDSYENILVNTESSATMNFLTDEIIVKSNTVGTTLNIPLTSPFVLSSFARYYAPSGDQLGRGPLPPAPNETTKYWIFWNISGTTNEISNLQITAPLGKNVTLTGKQSVSIGTSVTQNGNNIVWNVSSLQATMPTNSTVVGAAFEVAITPENTDLNKSPILIGTATATATDEFTGALVSGSSSSVNTNLINDSKGAAYGGTVQP